MKAWLFSVLFPEYYKALKSAQARLLAYELYAALQQSKRDTDPQYIRLEMEERDD